MISSTFNYILDLVSSTLDFKLDLFGLNLSESICFSIAMLLFMAGIILTITVAKMIFAYLLEMFIGADNASLIINYMTFPGTIVHEASHAIVAFLTGGKVVKVNLYGPSGDSLGSVSWVPRGNAFKQAIQKFLTGTAPIYGALIVIKLIETFVIPRFPVTGFTSITFGYVLARYIEFCVLLHMVPSKADLGSYWLTSIPFVFLIIAVLYFFYSVICQLFGIF